MKKSTQRIECFFYVWDKIKLLGQVYFFYS